ncbi:CatB-related O-acetyltransferase [Thomasclavelia spiroformis]|uniref:CatB-related O-acetyltransferase n=1 Tax=Thomasclavelia spiroformis TaxID=29348 RepID=UPI0024B153EE|nr:CatB-related O-acetyltransferase [Thomasclavelia spiroformis]
MNSIINSIKYRYELFRIKKFDTPDKSLERQWYKKNFNIRIGKYTYGYNMNNIAPGTKIGAFCSIASGVKIGLMNHPMNWVSSNPFLYYASRGFIDNDLNIPFKMGCVIENDVWIGSNAIILPGVHVGNGAVIAAGAVVTKNVSPYEVVGGNPAKHLKWRFEDQELRHKLNLVKWWEWSDTDIKVNIELFYNPKLFIEFAEKNAKNTI